jgi:hypothetical protein
MATRGTDHVKVEVDKRIECVKMETDARVASVEIDAKKRIDIIRRENENKILRLEADLTRTRVESTVISRGRSRRLRAESVVTGRLRGHGKPARRLGQSGMPSGFRKSGCDRLLCASCDEKLGLAPRGLPETRARES